MKKQVLIKKTPQSGIISVFLSFISLLLALAVPAAVALMLTACGSTVVTPSETPSELSPSGSIATPEPSPSGRTTPEPSPSGSASTPEPSPTGALPSSAPSLTPTPNENESLYGKGTHPGSSYTSEYRKFTSKKGELELLLTGLTKESTAYVLEAVKNYDPSAGGIFIFEHTDFVDAEKWNTYAETVYETNDSNQCWTAAASDLLWISGWATGYNNPLTGQPFSSEDDLFRYFNEKISNRGGEFSAAVNFFFTGEFCPNWNSAHPAMLNALEPSEEDGIIKNFVSTNAVKEYNLINDITQIEQLMNMNMRSGSPAVFQASIGFMSDNALRSSDHAVAVVGLIIDPEAKTPAERYKAIILSNSDDDAYPDDDTIDPENVSEEQRYAEKASRPNCYAVYNLALSEDSTGTKYWELKDYSPENRTALYSVSALPLPSDKVLTENRETEGTCSAINDPDFVPGPLFTTANTESVQDPFFFNREETIKTVFKAGEAINLNFFVSNHGFGTFDDEYRKDKSLSADWKVIAADGSVIAQGTMICNKPVHTGIDAGYLVNLNLADGKIVTWKAGKYTISVNVNPDHSIMEAYYLNNGEAVFEFEIK
jgi:hypothetical protein